MLLRAQDAHAMPLRQADDSPGQNQRPCLAKIPAPHCHQGLVSFPPIALRLQETEKDCGLHDEGVSI